MKNMSPVLILSILFTVIASTVYAGSTTAVLGGGVCINEILIDPNSTTNNFDTDGNGTAAAEDEFVELYNLSGAAVDISGWQLWDQGAGNWFTFPGAADSATTVLAAGAYAVVLKDVQTGGSLPTMTNPASLRFDADMGGGGLMNNGGDNVVLYDPGADQYIQLLYNGVPADDPTTDYTGFSATATRVGSVEDWGNDQDGKSLSRDPSGDTNVVIHDQIQGATQNASPNAIILHSFAAHSAAMPQIVWPLATLAVATTLVLGRLLWASRRRLRAS